MEMRIRASEFLTYYAAWLKDSGAPMGKEAAMAKLYSHRDRLLRGGRGDPHTRGPTASRRNIRRRDISGTPASSCIGGGTSEILKTLIARETLKNAR